MRPRLTMAMIASALAAGSLLGACGGDGGGEDSGSGEDVATSAAPPASDFPQADGRPLEQVLSVADQEGPVISPAARVLRRGENRFAFGVFTLEREPIPDAEVAIYAAPRSLQGPAIGPFPARIESLETEPAFRAKTTADDPDAAKVIYVADLPLERPGEWVFAALTKEDGGHYGGSLVPTPSRVGQFNPPDVGEKAPVTDTDTAAANPDLSLIDTRIPPSSMHDENLAEVLGKKPVVLLFATPALCQSRICGPVVDVAEQVKRDHGDDVAFIHQEIYNDNDASKGTRPPVNAYSLPSEPWLFVIDRNGVIRTAIEGAFSVDELERAVTQVEKLSVAEAGPAEMLAAEAGRRVPAVKERLQQLTSAAKQDAALIEEARVDIHGLKGAALVTGEESLGQLAARAEQRLADAAEQGELDHDLAIKLAAAMDAFRQGARAAAAGDPEPPSVPESLAALS